MVARINATSTIDGSAAVTITNDWERPTLNTDQLESETGTPDVVIVVFESLRADALQPAVMPFASSIAATRVQFQNHYAGSNSFFAWFLRIAPRSCRRTF